MEFLQPTSLDEALDMKAAHPEAEPVQGGTDVMVDINLDRHRPGGLLDLGHLAELRGIARKASISGTSGDDDRLGLDDATP